MDCRMPGFLVHQQLPEFTQTCPLSRWCHPTISSSVIPFSYHLQAFPASKWKWVKSLSRVWLFATPWTVADQTSKSMGFSRQEYWSGLPFPPPGDLPNPGIEPGSPALEADALTFEPPGKVFSNESVLRIRWPKYWSFSLSMSPSSEYSGLISFRMDWLDLLAVQGTLKSLL